MIREDSKVCSVCSFKAYTHTHTHGKATVFFFFWQLTAGERDANAYAGMSLATLALVAGGLCRYDYKKITEVHSKHSTRLQ